MYKGAQAVQTHVAQGSTVFKNRPVHSFTAFILIQVLIISRLHHCNSLCGKLDYLKYSLFTHQSKNFPQTKLNRPRRLYSRLLQ